MQRIIWADTIKCIAIWLMVLGHANLNNTTCNILIYSFHMPVFFFISGMFIKKRTLKEHMKKDFKSLLQPYFIFSILALSTCWISPYFHPELYSNIKNFADIFKHAIIGIFIMDDRVTNYSFLPYGPLWFLPALFIVRLFFQLNINIFHKHSIYLIATGLISMGLFYILRKVNIFSIDSVFLCYPFLLAGYFFKKNKASQFIYKIKSYVIIPLGVLFYTLAIYNGIVDTDGGVYGNHLVLFYINALLGIILLISLILCFKLDKIKILSYLGENSLIILATHGFIMIPIKVVLTLLNFNLNNLHIIISIIISLFVMFISFYLSKLTLKYCPFIVGKN